MFKTATAAALILAATSAGAMAQTTLKAGLYFSATAFTAITDPSGTCGGLGLKAGNVNYGSYNIGAAVLGKSAVSLLNAQPSGLGTVASPYALAATTCTLGSGFPAPVPLGGASLSGGTSTCNAGVYQLVPTSGAALPALAALSTSSFTLTSNVDIFLPGPAITLCSISITTLGVYSGK